MHDQADNDARRQEVVTRPIPADDAILEAAQSAQAAAASSRELLAELLDHERARFDSPRVTPKRLTEDARPWQNPAGLTHATRSFALLNFSTTSVFVGFGGRAANAASGIEVPARRYVILPWEVGDVEIDGDPNVALPAAGVQLYAIRFATPQAPATGPLDGSVDVGDRAGRLLGLVGPAAGSTWDISDRAARRLGKITELEGWSAVHAPAVNVLASASRAAAGAGLVNVCRSITATVAAGAAPAAVQLDVVLRDGATGAGAIIWQGALALQGVAGASDKLHASGLYIPGSPNTAMTLEFTAAGGLNTFERVTLGGFVL